MRLICPNCNAQYEVDDQVIPQAGRDVQCSACTHTWFQYPLGMALKMRAGSDDEDEANEDDDAPRPDGAGRPAPRIDRTVLNVLREEAEREITERKRLRGAMETQGDLGLVVPKKISRAGGTRYFGEPDEAPAPPPIPVDVDDEPAKERAPRRGRELLPDIDELSGTLEPGATATEADYLTDTKEPVEPRSAGFQNGLSVVALVGVGLIVLYVLAPVIVANVPVLDPPLRAYVSFIDDMRRLLAETLRGLLGGGA